MVKSSSSDEPVVFFHSFLMHQLSILFKVNLLSFEERGKVEEEAYVL